MSKNNLTRGTILVAEDFDDTRQVMKSILEGGGYRVLEAIDGNRALELAVRERPDLILMDLKLPQLNGLAVTRFIRQDERLRRIPIVIISAYDPEQHRSVALAAGCTEYLKKPVDFYELESLIGRLLPEDGKAVSC